MKRTLASLGESMSLFGSSIGLLIIVVIADNKGRKLSMAIGWILTVIGTLLMVTSYNIP